jgi:hypothetical protein
MSEQRIAIFSVLTLLGSFAFVSAAEAGERICKPTLGFREVRFSPMQPPTLERKWTAVLSVDASRCATASGRFGIMFSRMKENAPEIDFIEHFTWKPGAMEVSVNFWADEAVEGYWLNDVAACPCRE